MSKTTIFVIIGAVILLIVVIMVLNSGQADDTFAKDIMSITGGSCKDRCNAKCKSHGFFFDGRQRCEKACIGDCTSGVDISTKSY